MTLNCKGKLIDLSQARVMGILNLTPDSFYDGGRYGNEKAVLQRTEAMLEHGATFVDVGGYSSRPGADAVSGDEELKRMLPIIEMLVREFPQIILSVDTFRSKVAERCLDAGAAMINDISAGMQDENMFRTVARYKVPYIMMHMRGTPKSMQSRTDYNNITMDVLRYFSERIAKARKLGITDIIVDPGFGFAKTLPQNYELLSKLELFQNLDLPLLAGLSRKSMIYRTLDTTPEHALNGTTALHMVALQKGATILRVHDVKEAAECISLNEHLIR